MPDETASRFSWGRALRVAFVVLAAALGGLAVADQWNEVRGALDRLGAASVAGAFLAVLAGLTGGMLVWRSLLAGLGSPLRVPDAARIFFVGQLGKYVPGSVWPLVAQMELGRAHDVPRRRSGTAFVLTMLVVLASGLLAAAVTLPFFAYDAAQRFALALAVAPLLLAVLHPRVLNPVLDRLLRLARRPPLEHPLSTTAVARALGWTTVMWVAYGVQIWLLGVPLGIGGGDPAVRTLLLATGSFALAWCAGFLVVVTPAGAGVREVALVAALSPVLDSGEALVVALVSRLLMTVGDLVCAGVAGWTSRKRLFRSPAR
jgi:glycosyltransferase 2 family protein